MLYFGLKSFFNYNTDKLYTYIYNISYLNVLNKFNTFNHFNDLPTSLRNIFLKLIKRNLLVI